LKIAEGIIRSTVWDVQDSCLRGVRV
jgi:hypothetical protein